MSNLTRQQFIDKVAPFAIATMKDTNIPASLIIAQAILESNNGNSGLTKNANNLFGIKGTGTAGTYTAVTKEFINGLETSTTANFRKYNNWGESVSDYAKLILNGVSWDRKKYHGIIGKDGISASKEIAKAGYATDPNYSTKLINLIDTHNLQLFDSNIVIRTTEQRVHELETIVKSIVELLEKREQVIPAPLWFANEFPHVLDVMNDKTGTMSFWRSVAVCLRIMQK